MKKLFSLLTLALLTVSAWAGTSVTFDFTTGYENATELTTIQKDGVTLTFDKGTNNNNSTRWYENGTSARMYGGNTLNIASSGDNITEVVFTFTGTGNTMNSTATCSVDAGTYAEDGTTGTWTGNAQNFTITRGGTSGHARIASIEVIMGGEVVITVADPVFTPADGAMFTDEQEITLNCTTGGATIYYSTDGLVWNEYSEPFTITETTTVYAKAVLGEVESNVVSATYTKAEAPTSEPIVFKSSEDQGNGSTTRAEWTIVKDGITLNCTDGTVYDANYRIYQGATLTISSTVGNITMIEFVNTDNSRPISNLSTQTGTLTTNEAAGTWVGEAASVAFTASAQTRATEIHVYVDGGSTPIVTVAAPTLTEAQTFEESLTVTITNNEADATLYYSTDGLVWNEYTEALTLTETTTVYAKATKDGVDSQIVSATYTKVEPTPEGTIVFNVATDKGNGSTTRGEWTIVKDGITIVCSDGTVYDANYRIYQGATLTFSSTVGNIVKIEMDGVSSYPVSRFTTEVGTWETENNNGTWTGSATPIVFTAGSQARATEFRVYVDSETPIVEVAAPVLSPEHNTKFVGSQDVTITCETEGATIYYTTDSVYQVYESPFTITETTTVKAYAELNGTQTTVVSAKYIKLAEVDNIADANALDNKVDFIFNGDAVVTYQNGSNLWIRDASGSGLIYGNQVPAIAQGTVLKQGWIAQKYNFRGGLVPEFQYPTGVEASENVVAVEPFERESLELSNVNEYVIMKDMTIIAETDETVNNYQKYFYNAADSLVLYNQFDVEFTLEEGKTYDVVGTVTVYNEKPQLYIISVTEHENDSYLRGDVDMDGAIGIADITRLVDYILNRDAVNPPMSVQAADADLDGEIGIADVTKLVDYILNKTWD